MKVFRTELHGHRLELRVGDWGGQQLLLDGRLVGSEPYAALKGASHFFDIADEQGAAHHVEVRLADVSRWKIGRYRVLVRVDGVERCRLEPVNLEVPPDTCPNCGHSLKGVPERGGEVCCPECGRHTSGAMLDRPRE
jgi:hypothetical protein